MVHSDGSRWRKWDLHIHTPASFQWSGERFDRASEEHNIQLIAEMVEAINSSDVDVFGIMDYWTFDGYHRFRRHCRSNQSPECAKRVFPGIELRIEAPVDYRLNTHVLFDDAVTDQQLDDFLNTLRISVVDRPLSPEALAKFGSKLDEGKMIHHGYKPENRSDQAKMYELGCKTALITRDSWREALRLFQDKKCVVIQPYDTSDGLEDLDWKTHSSADTEFMRVADIFESRNQKNIDLFLGLGLPEKPDVGRAFLQNLGGKPKPVVSGSDAHRFSQYGVYPSGRSTWIKAQPTFIGLQQILVEPQERTFIGDEPPKSALVRENPTKYIRSITIQKRLDSSLEEEWFDCVLPLNPDLVAIIGNRGGGKSALADIIALLGNAHCSEMEFLNQKRFRSKRANKAIHFNATISWESGETHTLSLDAESDPDQPERVRYLPQRYIERLCDTLGDASQSDFETELRKVNFLARQ